MASLRAAVVQAEVASTLAEGLERTVVLTRDARRQGARLVVFPETWLPGYPAWLGCCRDEALWDHPPVKAVFERYAEECVEVYGESGAAIRGIAAAANMTLAIGVSERVAP